MSIFAVLPLAWLALLAAAVIGYLLGSVNWSIILTRLFKHREDIRKYGSGNAGMTNVLRSVGKVPAALTFVGDFLKCVAAVLIGWLIAALMPLSQPVPEFQGVFQYVAGAACVLGHIFPVFYGFRGGKGVVTSAAMIALTDWRVFLLVIATFVVVFAWKRIVSLASVVCAGAYPAYAFLLTFFLSYRRDGAPLWYLLFVTAMALAVGATVLIKHRSNIGRLVRGEEKPVIFGKK